MSELVLTATELTGSDFEELDEYPIVEGYSSVRILFDKKNFKRIYHAVEPVLSPEERAVLNKILDILKRTFSLRADQLDDDKEVHSYLVREVKKISSEYNLKIKRRKIKGEELDKLIYYVKRDQLGFGPIDILMHDPNIEDISVDAPDSPVYLYHRHHENMESTISWPIEDELDSYIIRLAQRCGKHISVAEPLLDSTLMDGSRVVMKLGREVSTRGSTFTIRKFREDPFTPLDLMKFGTLDSLTMAWTWMAVQFGMNMLFVGGTASGKTTTLNALSLYIPWQMKIVSIEETRELNLPHPNWIPGVTRQGTGGEGGTTGVVDMFDLLKAALRERPEYILVGEIRGAEAYVLFQAMATGHITYSTVHADSVPSLIHRLENKPIDIPRVMLPILDAALIQIQTRIGGKRVRRIREIVEIIGQDPHSQELLTNQVFAWDHTKDKYRFMGKSYVLDKVMVKGNFSKEEVMKELKQRQKLLEWMMKTNVTGFKNVANIINQYYIHPEVVVRRMNMELASGGQGTGKVRAVKSVRKVKGGALSPQRSEAEEYLDDKTRARIASMWDKERTMQARENSKIEATPENRRDAINGRFMKARDRREAKIRGFEQQMINRAKAVREKQRAKEQKIQERNARIESRRGAKSAE
jgi:archaeal flagellar protein FlaI